MALIRGLKCLKITLSVDTVKIYWQRHISDLNGVSWTEKVTSHGIFALPIGLVVHEFCFRGAQEHLIPDKAEQVRCLFHALAPQVTPARCWSSRLPWEAAPLCAPKSLLPSSWVGDCTDLSGDFCQLIQQQSSQDGFRNTAHFFPQLISIQSHTSRIIGECLNHCS